MKNVNEPSLVELIEVVWRRVKTELADEPIAQAADLRPSQLRVLARTPLEGIRGSELAARTQMTAQALGTIVDVLVHAGYLVRVPDRKDRRAKTIRPTSRGQSVHSAANRKLEELEERWRGELGDDRWLHLRETLAALADLH